MPAKPSDQLSNLTKVELRDIWPHEATDFTNWLAEEDNLKLLSDEIGIDIELISTEAGVGQFSVDILAQEADGDRKIVIENQLGKTDHDHLGKIITYASGYDAEILIWLVREARNEHKQAVEWLNEHAEKLNIFIVEIQAWKIDNSKPAPKFNIVIQPNNWQKAMKKAGDATAPSNTKIRQLEFWNGFVEYARTKTKTLNFRASNSSNHLRVVIIAIKPSIARLTVLVYEDFRKVACELFIPDKKETYVLYNQLHQQKEEIEQALQLELDWQRIEGRQRSKIKLVQSIAPPNDGTAPDCWHPHYKWLLEKAEKFEEVFTPRIEQFASSNK